MRFVNIDAIMNDLEMVKENMGEAKMSISSIIEMLDGYPKLEFDPADRKDREE